MNNQNVMPVQVFNNHLGNMLNGNNILPTLTANDLNAFHHRLATLMDMNDVIIANLRQTDPRSPADRVGIEERIDRLTEYNNRLNEVLRAVEVELENRRTLAERLAEEIKKRGPQPPPDNKRPYPFYNPDEDEDGVGAGRIGGYLVKPINQKFLPFF
jgi:hypothetical protein